MSTTKRIASNSRELLVVLGVGVELVDGVKDGLTRLSVGEALEEGAKLSLGRAEVVIVANVAELASRLSGGIGGNLLVVLGPVEEELDGLCGCRRGLAGA